MSEIANTEGSSETEKPVNNEVKFPPFPEPRDADFDDDISEEERSYYKIKFKDLTTVKNYKLHCTACDRHMGCSARNERIRVHPMLHTLVCHACYTFYNSGEFEKGDDGSELYCRWCGQGGQVYCCSDCPHVFCAKCIKRNLGVLKIKEIENADDWKCFKCNSDCLRDLRAICWAVLRYCDLKQKVTSKTQDPDLRAAYERDCATDPSECCKHKLTRKTQKLNEALSKRKKELDVKKEVEMKKELLDIKPIVNILPKMPSTIQVKKFASINLEETSKPEKKSQKRSASPKPKTVMVKNPAAILPATRVLTPVAIPPIAKKMRFPNCNINAAIRFTNTQDRKQVNTYTRVRPPKLTPLPNNYFNGFSGNIFHCTTPINDNINLSLESLTQGLDMAAVAAMSVNTQPIDDDVVCTPDFPLEPLCEVTEDNDDDVQCITPVSAATSKPANPTPLPTITIPRTVSSAPEVTPDNIIQMTENDVTVNESTGGLKFRVDPQTLSSNKMYRLPDGRIFAINANPNMPGGYSATIVAVTEANKGVPKGATFAAKLSSISALTSTPKQNRNQITRVVHSKRKTPKIAKPSKASEDSPRECDLNVPIEWYRYNLIDAVDALEYSLSRLHKLKKEATSIYLRTRSVNEMRSLHRTLERLLNTSSTRFNEIRDNLNKGLKEYTSKKAGAASEDDDDDVEILPDIEEDPIFIDENSTESNINDENQEVDLTGPGSSECNDSGENRTNNFTKNDSDPLIISETICGNQRQPFNITGSNDNLINLLQRKDRQLNETSSNNMNGVEISKRVTEISTLIDDDWKRNESLLETNNSTKESPESKEEPQKNEEEDIETPETNSVKVLKDENQICLSDIRDSDNSHEKTQDTNNKTKSIEKDTHDANNKSKGCDDKKPTTTQDSDDKHQDVNVKMELSNCEANDDEDMQDVDINMKDVGERIQSAEQKIQDTDDIMQDAGDKVQDNEMSEELIETLLKDDSVDNTANNSDAPALKVT